MELEEHKKRHKDLHTNLDELVADFIYHTGLLPSKTTIRKLMEWSHEQIDNPSKVSQL